jgi:acetyl-CoA carboxylase alpha subunit
MAKYKLMVLDEEGQARVYQTEDETMYKAMSAINHIHALQHPNRPFRITYIEEVFDNQNKLAV